MKETNAENFKTRDAASYDSLSDQFDQYTERLTDPLARHLISLAEIAPGERLLDVGTGTGVVALRAARIADSETAVHGIDLSAEMLAKAAEKAKRLGIERKVKFSRMDAESLGFEDQSFNSVVSLFALLHFPDPQIALREIRRVLRPNGKLILAVGSGIPLFTISGWIHLARRLPDLFKDLQKKRLIAPQFLDSLVLKNIPETSEPEESNLAAHTHRSRARTVASLVKNAGFRVIKTDWRGHREIINTPEEFWEIQRTFSSIARKRLSAAEPEAVEVLRREFTEKCRAVQSKGGRLVYPFGAFYVVARRDQRSANQLSGIAAAVGV